MNRRDILKAGVVLAVATPTAAYAPMRYHPSAEVEDPKAEVRRLSNRIAELLEQIGDYERVVIQAKSVGRWAVYSEFTV